MRRSDSRILYLLARDVRAGRGRMLEFIETGDVARIIERSPARVVQLSDAGLLPIAARTERGVRLFRREDIERFLAARVARKDSVAV